VVAAGDFVTPGRAGVDECPGCHLRGPFMNPGRSTDLRSDEPAAHGRQEPAPGGADSGPQEPALGGEDRRQTPSHSPLSGLLDGTLRVAWQSATQREKSGGAVPVVWEGSGADPQ